MINSNIKATNIELTDAIRTYAMEKLSDVEKLLDPHDTSVYAQIEVGKTTQHHKQGEVFRAEINLSLAGGSLRAESEQEDLYAALDEVKDELKREVRKFRGKKETLARRGARTLKRLLRRNAE